MLNIHCVSSILTYGYQLAKRGENCNIQFLKKEKKLFFINSTNSCNGKW